MRNIILSSIILIVALSICGCCGITGSQVYEPTVNPSDNTVSHVTPTIIAVSAQPTSDIDSLNLEFVGNFTNNPNYYKTGTPENTLVLYMNAIYRHDYDKLVALRSPSWVKKQNDAYTQLGIEVIKPYSLVKTMYEDIYLQGYDIPKNIDKLQFNKSRSSC